MTPATFDDLKIAWKELGEKLERQNLLALQQLTEKKRARFRSGLRLLALGQSVQLLAGVLVVAWSAWFWGGHLSQPVLLGSGVLLQLYGILFIAFAARDLLLIHQIDYAAPVLAMQKQLAELRAWHLRTGVWLGYAGSIAWLPFMLIVLHLLGAEFWLAQPHKLIWLATTALVCLGFNYALVRLSRSSGKCGAAIRRNWIGRTVNRTQAALDEVAQFERELT